MNSHLLYNMCASVYADFCRPTGLESARPRPGTYSLWNHQSYHKLSVYGKTQYYTQCGKTIWPLCHSHWRCHTGLWRTPISAITLALILILTIIDRPCRQCSRSSICQSSWSVSMNPVNNWIQSNATSKLRMGLTSWPHRRTWLGRSCVSWCRDNSYSTYELKQTSILKSLLTISGTTAICYGRMPHPISQVYRVYLHRPRPPSMDNWIGQSTSLQLKLRTQLQLRSCWIIALIVWRSDWQYKMT